MESTEYCRGRDEDRGAGRDTMEEDMDMAAGDWGRSLYRYGEREPLRRACTIAAISSSDSPASVSCDIHDGGSPASLQWGQRGLISSLGYIPVVYMNVMLKNS